MAQVPFTALLVASALSATWQPSSATDTGLAVAGAHLGADHTPSWAVKGAPEGSKKFCGFEVAKNITTTTVYRATEKIGAYNHAAMIGCVALTRLRCSGCLAMPRCLLDSIKVETAPRWASHAAAVHGADACKALLCMLHQKSAPHHATLHHVAAHPLISSASAPPPSSFLFVNNVVITVAAILGSSV
jgi:hypothetical protein